MSDVGIFAIFDAKAEQYLQPFFAPTAAAATRALMGAVSDPKHEFNRFAEDYCLFEVGSWDPETGKISGCAPTDVVGAWSLKAALSNGGSNA